MATTKMKRTNMEPLQQNAIIALSAVTRRSEPKMPSTKTTAARPELALRVSPEVVWAARQFVGEAAKKATADKRTLNPGEKYEIIEGTIADLASPFSKLPPKEKAEIVRDVEERISIADELERSERRRGNRLGNAFLMAQADYNGNSKSG